LKRDLLLKKITENGAVFLRHGGGHDIYYNPKTKIKQPIPRHTDIEERLAKNII
jgi:predicted RNA binding protein YcfA (HicA-like mRNA interferase family)